MVVCFPYWFCIQENLLVSSPSWSGAFAIWLIFLCSSDVYHFGAVVISSTGGHHQAFISRSFLFFLHFLLCFIESKQAILHVSYPLMRPPPVRYLCALSGWVERFSLFFHHHSYKMAAFFSNLQRLCNYTSFGGTLYRGLDGTRNIVSIIIFHNTWLSSNPLKTTFLFLTSICFCRRSAD